MPPPLDLPLRLMLKHTICGVHLAVVSLTGFDFSNDVLIHCDSRCDTFRYFGVWWTPLSFQIPGSTPEIQSQYSIG